MSFELWEELGCLTCMIAECCSCFEGDDIALRRCHCFEGDGIALGGDDIARSCMTPLRGNNMCWKLEC